MNEIKLRGKLIRVNGKIVRDDTAIEKEHKAEIFLTPPSPEEIKNLKGGDEVLVKYKIFKSKVSGMLDINCHSLTLYDIVAILPKEPNQEPKKIEKLEYDKLDIARIDPDKRQFVQAIQFAINSLRKKIDELIDAINKLKEG